MTCAEIKRLVTRVDTGLTVTCMSTQTLYIKLNGSQIKSNHNNHVSGVQHLPCRVCQSEVVLQHASQRQQKRPNGTTIFGNIVTTIEILLSALHVGNARMQRRHES